MSNFSSTSFLVGITGLPVTSTRTSTNAAFGTSYQFPCSALAAVQSNCQLPSTCSCSLTSSSGLLSLPSPRPGPRSTAVPGSVLAPSPVPVREGERESELPPRPVCRSFGGPIRARFGCTSWRALFHRVECMATVILPPPSPVCSTHPHPTPPHPTPGISIDMQIGGCLECGADVPHHSLGFTPWSFWLAGFDGWLIV